MYNKIIIDAAVDYLEVDLSIVPVEQSKKCTVEWKQFQRLRLPTSEAQRLFSNAWGLAVIGGAVSGGLEVIDFDAHGKDIDTVYARFLADEKVAFIVKRHNICIERTMHGGYHLIYTYETDNREGNQKLANWENGETMIETRGEGGYTVVYPSPGYTLIQGAIEALPRLSQEERDYLIDFARNFTLAVEHPQKEADTVGIADTTDPVSFFNWNKAGYAKNLLKDIGWKLIDTDQKTKIEYWQRPGKDAGESHSATWGYKDNSLFVFSSSAPPFKPECYYTPFQILTMCRFNGDYRAAMDWVAEQYQLDNQSRETHKTQNTMDLMMGEDTPLCENMTFPLLQNETKPGSETPPKQSDSNTHDKSIEPIPPFPIDGLPKIFQDLIKACTDVYKTPADFWAAAFFAGTAAGMGNAIQLTGKYTNNTALWWMFVAPSGTGKSEPIDFAMNPIKRIDSANHKKYVVQKVEYDEIKTLNKKDREARNIHETPSPPKCSQTIVKDVTPESMADAHGNNPRGIVIHRDELMGWINDIGRYAKSGEVETMLSIWSGKGTVINRKGLDTILRIDEPCISMIGGVVVKKLKDLAKDGRADNGMIQRCIFVWPDFCDKQKYSKAILPLEYSKAYDDYINKLLSIPEGNTITLSEAAELLYAEFYNCNVAKANTEGIDFIKEMYAKFDIIVLRIALIVHGMKIVCEGNTSDMIEPETMEYAIRVTEYFRATGLKVYAQVCEETPLIIKPTDVIKYIKNIRGNNNQSEIARCLRFTQQYVNKIFKDCE